MGQENGTFCCCNRNKNENEFENENSEENENPNDNLNKTNLKSYVKNKNKSILKQRDSYGNTIEPIDTFINTGKTLNKQTNFLLLRNNNNEEQKFNSPKRKSNMQIRTVSQPHEFFSSRAYSTLPVKTSFQPNKFLAIYKIQKLFHGFIYRKNYYPSIKNKLELFNLDLLKGYYNKFLTENLKKQEENLGINHSENSYKTLLIIEKDINKNSNNFFTKLYVFQYRNIKSFYVGEVDINNCLNGRGILTMENGTKYNGYFIKNEFTGKGNLINKDGEYFKGYFENGVLNGNGIQKLLNGCSFEGNFIKGIKNGFGKEDSDEFIYEGEYKNDQKNGNGKMYFKLLHDSYEGNFVNNNINGNGIYKWKNGDCYEGNFENGKMNGKGKYSWPDGGFYEGDYVNNIKEGNGKFKWPNGKIYEGPFKNGNPNGNGILIVKNIYYEINFKDGVIKGKLNEISKKKYIKIRNKNNNEDDESIGSEDMVISSRSGNSFYIKSTNERNLEKKKFFKNVEEDNVSFQKKKSKKNRSFSTKKNMKK